MSLKSIVLKVGFYKVSIFLGISSGYSPIFFERGHLYVCYADDYVIFCKIPRVAERVKESITDFIGKNLHIKVNHEKTVALVWGI